MSQSNNSYSIEGNKMIIENSILKFDYPIIESVEISDMIIVRLDVPYKVVYNENVFGISLSSAKVVWQVTKRESPLTYCSYTKIRAYEGIVILINWCSFYLHVNPLDGAIIEEGYTK